MIILEDSNGFALHIEDAPLHPGKKMLSWQDETGAISDMIFSVEELEVLRKHLNAAHEEKKGG